MRSLEVDPNITGLIRAINQTTRGIWGRLTVVTANKLIGSAAEALKECVDSAGRIAVRYATVGPALEQLQDEGAQFEMVNIGNLGASDRGDQTGLATLSSALLKPQGGFLVLHGTSRDPRVSGRVSALAAEAEQHLGRRLFADRFLAGDYPGLGSGYGSSAVFVTGLGQGEQPQPPAEQA